MKIDPISLKVDVLLLIISIRSLKIALIFTNRTNRRKQCACSMSSESFTGLLNDGTDRTTNKNKNINCFNFFWLVNSKVFYSIWSILPYIFPANLYSINLI